MPCWRGWTRGLRNWRHDDLSVLPFGLFAGKIEKSRAENALVVNINVRAADVAAEEKLHREVNARLA